MDLLLTHGYFLHEDPKELQIMKPYAPLGILYLSSHLRAKGFAVEMGLLIVGFEFEYASSSDDPAAKVPSLKTGSGNVLLQSPVAFFGVQPYVTTGAGYLCYRGDCP